MDLHTTKEHFYFKIIYFQVLILTNLVTVNLSMLSKTFSLPSTLYGCPHHPAIRWETVAVSFNFPSGSVSWSPGHHLLGPIRHNFIQFSSCVASVEDDEDQPEERSAMWTKGNYCILRSKECPDGKWFYVLHVFVIFVDLCL